MTVASIGLRLGPLGLAITPLGGGVLRLMLLAFDAHTTATHVGQTTGNENHCHDSEDQHVEHGSLEHNPFSRPKVFLRPAQPMERIWADRMQAHRWPLTRVIEPLPLSRRVVGVSDDNEHSDGSQPTLTRSEFTDLYAFSADMAPFVIGVALSRSGGVPRWLAVLFAFGLELAEPAAPVGIAKTVLLMAPFATRWSDYQR